MQAYISESYDPCLRLITLQKFGHFVKNFVCESDPGENK